MKPMLHMQHSLAESLPKKLPPIGMIPLSEERIIYYKLSVGAHNLSGTNQVLRSILCYRSARESCLG